MLNAWSLIQLCSEMEIWESDWVKRALPFIGRGPHWPLIIEWTTGKWWRLREAGPGWRKWVPEGMPWGSIYPPAPSSQYPSCQEWAAFLCYPLLPWCSALLRCKAMEPAEHGLNPLILWARINLSTFNLFLSDICHSEEKLTNTICYHSPLTTMFVPTPLAPHSTGEPQPLLCSNEWKLKSGIKNIQWPPSEWLGDINRCYKTMVV